MPVESKRRAGIQGQASFWRRCHPACCWGASPRSRPTVPLGDHSLLKTVPAWQTQACTGATALRWQRSPSGRAEPLGWTWMGVLYEGCGWARAAGWSGQRGPFILRNILYIQLLTLLSKWKYKKNSRRLSCFDLTLSSVLRAGEPQRRYLLSYMVISAVLWAAAVISWAAGKGEQERGSERLFAVLVTGMLPWESSGLQESLCFVGRHAKLLWLITAAWASERASGGSARNSGLPGHKGQDGPRHRALRRTGLCFIQAQELSTDPAFR